MMNTDLNDINVFVGKRIREYRKKVNLTQNELAKKLEINNTTLSAYEMGKISLNLPMLCKISEILHLNVLDLLPVNNSKLSQEEAQFFQKYQEAFANMNPSQKEKHMEIIRFAIAYYNQ